jgi:hypothetical protein
MPTIRSISHAPGRRNVFSWQAVNVYGRSNIPIARGATTLSPSADAILLARRASITVEDKATLKVAEYTCIHE